MTKITFLQLKKEHNLEKKEKKLFDQIKKHVIFLLECDLSPIPIIIFRNVPKIILESSVKNLGMIILETSYPSKFWPHTSTMASFGKICPKIRA